MRQVRRCGVVLLGLFGLGTLACGSGIEQFVGDYNGTVSIGGVEVGTWEARVTSEGNLSGTGLRNGGEFSISGQVVASGKLSFGATERETQTATFDGKIDPDGTVEGTWEEVDGSPKGTFAGSRK